MRYLLFFCACVGIYFFCNTQTKGFRPYFLLSNLPNDPRWETVCPNEDVNFDQSFTYLGSGGWCYAFLGEDQKTILKFYKHTHLTPSALFASFSFDKLLLRAPKLAKGSSYFQEFNFNSCMLLEKEVRQEAGLLYVHLNKTVGKLPAVTLIDPIGVRHPIKLDETEFVVQKKAELLIPYFERLIERQEITKAKHSIDDLILLFVRLHQKGIKDLDQGLRNNFGFCDERVMILDISSFVSDPEIKDPENYKREIAIKMQRLQRFLRKKAPELLLHFEKRLEEI